MSPGASRRSSAFWQGRDARRYLRRRARLLAAGAGGRNLPAAPLRAALLARARGLRAACAGALGLAAAAGAAAAGALAGAPAAASGACGAPSPVAGAAARLPL